MMNKDQQERLFASLQDDIELIYKTVYKLPQSYKRDVVLLMLAVLQKNIAECLDSTRESWVEIPPFMVSQRMDMHKFKMFPEHQKYDTTFTTRQFVDAVSDGDNSAFYILCLTSGSKWSIIDPATDKI